MNFLIKFFDNLRPKFESKGPLHVLYPAFEMIETFLISTNQATKGSVHLRDSIDLKRAMITVFVALIPAIFFAIYNTGYQANIVISATNQLPEGFRADIMNWLGISFNPLSFVSNAVYGSLFFLPIFLVTNIVGGFWEALFAIVRRHEINEGFLVTGILFPLTLPPTIPLWQVAVGISFGVIFAKEIFGGTGKNIFNPALMARAFLFFSYPAQISGDKVWTAVDGHSGATILSNLSSKGMDFSIFSWWDCFWGFVPGSMGETSVVACLIGALILIITGIGSWRIILSSILGVVAISFLLNTIDSQTNPMYAVTFDWHIVSGSFAFATVFMATDPVSAPVTNLAKYVYGFLIGVLGILIRSINPAYPEGFMLAILFMNAFSPLLDHFVMERDIKRRRLGYGR